MTASATAALVLLVALGACAPQERPAAARRPTSAPSEVLHQRGTFEGWVRQSDVTALGVIRAVGALRWNSADGARWTDTDWNDLARPYAYQEVRLEVQEHGFGRQVQPGATLVVNLFAARDHGGALLSSDAVGSRMLVTAYETTMRFADLPERTALFAYETATYREVDTPHGPRAVRLWSDAERRDGLHRHGHLVAAARRGVTLAELDALPLPALLARARAASSVDLRNELGYDEIYGRRPAPSHETGP